MDSALSTQHPALSVDSLTEVLPRIGRYVGKTVVLKVGGSVGGEGTVMEDVVTLKRLGVQPVVVHGGGRRISKMLTTLGVETRFVEGRRYTDEATLDVAHMVLMLLNGQLVSYLASQGVSAVGLNGLDGGLLRARIRDESLGLVGDIEAVDQQLLSAVMREGYVPVIAPLAAGPESQPLNVNADTVAGAVAHALAAEAFVLFTDVPGVKDASGVAQPTLDEADVRRMIADGTIHGGMLPKIESCLRALETVPRAHIVDGRAPRALFRELFSERSGGTVLTAATS